MDSMNEIMAELTPEERAALSKATPEDWAQAIAECATDPSFWATVAGAGINGFLEGLLK